MDQIKRESAELTRRAMMQSASLIALPSLLTACAGTHTAGAATTTNSPALRGLAATKVVGKEFDFLAGEWKIKNRRLKDGTTDQWLEFPGEASIWRAIDGAASIEWLRIPVNNFAGLGVRIYRPTEQKWADHWVNAKSGVLGEPMLGTFANGVATFISEETIEGKTMQYRSMWDEISDNGCRWSQSSSADGGKSWADSWVMHWERVNS